MSHCCEHSRCSINTFWQTDDYVRFRSLKVSGLYYSQQLKHGSNSSILQQINGLAKCGVSCSLRKKRCSDLNYNTNETWRNEAKETSYKWFIYMRYLEWLTEKAMALHSSTLAWKIPWTEEPGRLQSMQSQRVRHNWATSLSLSTFMHWRRTWQPTPVFLPGESQGQWSLVGCHLWGCTESDVTEVT